MSTSPENKKTKKNIQSSPFDYVNCLRRNQLSTSLPHRHENRRPGGMVAKDFSEIVGMDMFDISFAGESFPSSP